MVQVIDIESVECRLEEVKVQRLEEARRLGIHDMVKLVATVLGHGDVYNCTYVKEAGDLLITWNCVHGASVLLGGKVVYEEWEGREVTAYVPGAWVTQLINLYKTAKIEAAKKRVRAQLEAIKEEARKWGLTPEDLGLCEEV